MDTSELQKRLHFLTEIDKLKNVVRASPLIDQTRKENSAEHSWHLAMYALVLVGHSKGEVDLSRVIKMLLIHDIVEIDSGDTPIHGKNGIADQEQKESEAADRLFGLLPSDQGAELKSLWLEFESGQSVDARFAKSLDRFQPLIHNIKTGGGTWAESSVSHQQVLKRYGPTIQAGSDELWATARQFVSDHFDARDLDGE